jgi:hypothetical protein
LNLVYLIGAPGAGKTTVTRALESNWIPVADATDPVKHRVWFGPQGTTISLGHDRAPFGGTDTLSYTAINVIERWLPTLPEQGVENVYGEGDRLANPRFFNLCRSVGDLKVFYLDRSDEQAQTQRAQRASDNNLPMQNASWVAGRATKARNLAVNFGAKIIPGELSSEDAAQFILDNI